MNQRLIPRTHRWLTVLALSGLVAACHAATIAGTVYHDANRNGMLDAGEPGLANLRVTDGISVSVSDTQGRYALQCPQTYCIIRVSWPDNYWPTAGRFWRAVTPDGPIASGIDFGLHSAPHRADTWGVFVVQMTDTHVLADTARLLREVMEQVDALSPDLVVATGDLVMDTNGLTSEEQVRSLLGHFTSAASALKAPLFTLPGNHEMCASGAKGFEGDQALIGEGAFRRVLPVRAPRTSRGVSARTSRGVSARTSRGVSAPSSGRGPTVCNGLPAGPVAWAAATPASGL